jgi:hypothetical protein
MKVFWNSLAVVGAIVAIGSPAQAAQVTFSLVGSKDPATMFNYSDPSGLTLLVTALGQMINQNAAGLGIDGNGNLSINKGEKIRFQFNQTVKLIDAVFSDVDKDDNYIISTGESAGSLVQQGPAGTLSTTGESVAKFSVVDPKDKTTKIFQFSTYDSTDDYRLKSITVDDGKPTAVPTPAMLPGLVGLGLGLLRRRIAV